MTGKTFLAALFGPPLVLAALATDLPAARMLFALALCLVLPGLGWARKMHYSDFGDTLALACVLSISITVGVGTVMVLSHSWSFSRGLVTLGGLALAGFVPGRLIVDRARAATRLRIPGFAHSDRAWSSWYRRTLSRAKVRRAGAGGTSNEASAVRTDRHSDVEPRAEEVRTREAATKQAASKRGSTGTSKVSC